MEHVGVLMDKRYTPQTHKQDIQLQAPWIPITWRGGIIWSICLMVGLVVVKAAWIIIYQPVRLLYHII